MNMYVGNLSYNVKEVDLREVMEEYGTVGSVKLIIDRDTRRSKGFAFVEMPETSEASNGSPDKPGGLSIQLCKSEKKEFYIRYSS